MAVVIRVVPYAREGGGLATAFLGRAGLAAIMVGAAAALGLAAWWRPVAGPAAVVAGVVAGIGVVAVAKRRLGGFTGDVLGAAGVIAETVGLIVASAKW
jgi:adenosylcobinamide-GDP ribazoletransferase